MSCDSHSQESLVDCKERQEKPKQVTSAAEDGIEVLKILEMRPSESKSSVYELKIQYINNNSHNSVQSVRDEGEEPSSETTWVSFPWIYQRQVAMVTEFFKVQKLDFGKILKEEQHAMQKVVHSRRFMERVKQRRINKNQTSAPDNQNAANEVELSEGIAGSLANRRVKRGNTQHRQSNNSPQHPTQQLVNTELDLQEEASGQKESTPTSPSPARFSLTPTEEGEFVYRAMASNTIMDRFQFSSLNPDGTRKEDQASQWQIRSKMTAGALNARKKRQKRFHNMDVFDAEIINKKNQEMKQQKQEEKASTPQKIEERDEDLEIDGSKRQKREAKSADTRPNECILQPPDNRKVLQDDESLSNPFIPQAAQPVAQKDISSISWLADLKQKSIQHQKENTEQKEPEEQRQKEILKSDFEKRLQGAKQQMHNPSFNELDEPMSPSPVISTESQGDRPMMDSGISKTPIDDCFDCPEKLKDKLQTMPGNPWENRPKMVHAMRVCETTSQILYLCSWEQDYLTYFFEPSWILAQMLTLFDSEAECQRNNKLIADFYMGLTKDLGSQPESATHKLYRAKIE